MRLVFVSRFYQSLRRFIIQKFLRPSAPFVYVALGDSSVEGIGASKPHRSYASIIYSTILETHKNAEYYNFGKNRAPIKQVLNEQLDKTINLNPSLVTISVGANDIRLKTKLTTFEKDLRVLIGRLQSETTAEIVINNIPDFSLAPAIPKHLKKISSIMINRFNRVIQKVAKEYGITFVDLYVHSKVFAKHYPESVGDDKFHPSDFGYALWATTIIANIQHVIMARK